MSEQALSDLAEAHKNATRLIQEAGGSGWTLTLEPTFKTTVS
jgi:hypothetical protein